MKDYEVPMTITFRTTVTVQADSAAAAVVKAQRAAFYDDGMNGAEMCDWEVTGAAREIGADQ
ncbi:hypothetical protein [Phenylobacterium kunshanense]|uniref:Uncharacterized protein n=1 Tax=Phenylobacterium kunshanense TaxID=1445034 RepID=A0A328BNA7_9CAUL|nr:hypothetical protein [Phenylobacterium kunshanense]RAK68840.1 hypothetical protein DJ019_02155 [Phenylobacterium kunshanense]